MFSKVNRNSLFNVVGLFSPNGLFSRDSSGFSPPDLANLALWLDAYDTSTITEVGGSVSQWDDKSGLGNHVTQGTGSAQPTTGATTQNGKNVIDFDGSNTWMEVPSGLYTIPNGNNTLFIVSKQTASVTSRDRILNMGVSGATRYGMLYESSSDISYVSSNGFNTVSVADGADGSFNVYTGFRDGTTQSVSRNGGTADTDTLADDSGSIDKAVLAGTAAATPSELLDGSIAEVVLYNVKLSASEISQVENYLINKWGI